MYWSKNHEIKSKYQLNLYFTFEIIIHNRSCRKLFFLPLLNPIFHYSNLQKVFNWPYTSQKTICSHQNLFFLQNKGLNNPIWVGRHTKKQSKVVQASFKDITLYHSAIMSTKWWNMKATPTLIHLEDNSIKIIGRGLLYSYYDLRHKATRTNFSTNCNVAQQKSFLKSHFSSFAMKQHGNSWKLRWVNSTVLNNKIWLILI